MDCKRISFTQGTHGVHKEVGIDVLINILQTQGFEITLIQCCLIVTTLKQRWTKVISTPCLQGNCLETHQENIHNEVEGCNLSKITKFIFMALHLLKLPKLPKPSFPPLDSYLSVLVRLCNICRYKTLTGLFQRRK